MNTKRITFANSRGERLAARLELPEDEQPLAYALFAHCFTCSKDLTAAVHIARALSSRRIAVLRFDFTGLGESEGEFAATTFSSEVSDLVAAARFLEQEYEAPRLLIGHSLGGAAVLAAAAEIPTTAAVVAIAAPFRPVQVWDLLGEAAERIEETGQGTVTIAGRTFTIRKSLLDDLDAHHPEDTLRRLRAALLVMHAPGDQVVGIDNATDIYRAAPHPKSFVSLDSADHLLSDSRDSRYAGGIIAAWAGRYLGVPETPVPSQAPPEAADSRVTARTGAAGFRTELFADGFSLVADEPVADGGGNEGPSPYDYLLVALGACTGMTLRMYARSKGWPLEEVVVRLSHRKVHADDCRDCDEKERRLDTFEREVELRGELDEAQRQRLLEIAGRCPVHRTLTAGVRVVTTLRPV
ncbi:OsmC family protein [Geobacter sp. FeAm09]|uniref:bifunctional alpha/beta hydrolase/OsmC family protein n=1 Tax=Geobacter sp. FeAm09 TaxID=2597769 RepID=UPI0011ECCAD8|nr:bifunctional alpha/beta hydrolase/OsmC family protein [Geobacter sp. FeAm09]QEM69320.1 OsmC family protein [Geobacter sp. FeAm09]